MSSTETGAIFGNIVFEAAGFADRAVVVLNDVHIDIMDYIRPASCADVAFRSMWAEFEWENKVMSCDNDRCQYQFTFSLSTTLQIAGGPYFPVPPAQQGYLRGRQSTRRSPM